jgi:hypothetical protein
MDSYKIKITRRDLVAQITSYYVATLRNVWKQDTMSVDEYMLPIDTARLTQLAKVIIDNNTKLNTCGIDFDEELVYEDQNFSLPARFKTTQPTNLDKIISAVKQTIASINSSQ